MSQPYEPPFNFTLSSLYVRAYSLYSKVTITLAIANPEVARTIQILEVLPVSKTAPLIHSLLLRRLLLPQNTLSRFFTLVNRVQFLGSCGVTDLIASLVLVMR